MNKPLLIPLYFFLLSMPICTSAQDGSSRPTWKNEVGVSLFSMITNYKDSYGAANRIVTLNGIKYSRHIGRSAFRGAFEYRFEQLAGSGDFVGESKSKEGRIYLGYQLAFSNKAIRPYLAMDVFYLASTYWSDFLGGYAGIYAEQNLTSQGVGFAPAVGTYFRLFDSLTVSWEANVECFWVNDQGTLVRSEPYNQQPLHAFQIDRTDYYWIMNPIKSISLNYGF